MVKKYEPVNVGLINKSKCNLLTLFIEIFKSKNCTVLFDMTFNFKFWKIAGKKLEESGLDRMRESRISHKSGIKKDPVREKKSNIIKSKKSWNV